MTHIFEHEPNLYELYICCALLHELCCALLHELCCLCCRKEKEIGALHQGMEEQSSEIAALQRKVRELETKIEELEEDLENERNNKNRVKQQD